MISHTFNMHAKLRLKTGPDIVVAQLGESAGPLHRQSITSCRGEPRINTIDAYAQSNKEPKRAQLAHYLYRDATGNMKLVSGCKGMYTHHKHVHVELDALRREEAQRSAAADSLARKYKLMNLIVQGSNTIPINEFGSRQRANSLTANTPLVTCCHT